MTSFHTTPTITALRDENAQLRQRLLVLRFNLSFNCMRREAMLDYWPTLHHPAYAVVFFDLDGLNAANFRHGYEGVNTRIRLAFDAVRHMLIAPHILGQWQGGDEFVLAIPDHEASIVAHHLQTCLNAHDLSATCAIVAATPDLVACVARGEQLIKAARGGARGEGQRGIIVSDDDPPVQLDAERTVG